MNSVSNLKKVLVVDDSPDACETMAELLGDHFEVMAISDPQVAIDKIGSFGPDLILLDYLMPAVSGLEICKQIRDNKAWAGTPILFVSGVESSQDRVLAFEAGANDFIAKPFSIDELIARMNVRLSDQEKRGDGPSKLVAGNLTMNLITREVSIGPKVFKLTVKQFDILKLLVENQNNVVARKDCLDQVWGEVEVTSRNIDSQINYLKKKLDGFEGSIIAVPGIGYKLILTPEEPTANN